jgi:glucose-6-phosphate isomerase
MLTKNIKFRNFIKAKDNLKIKKDLNLLLKTKLNLLKTLETSYKYNYTKKLVKKLKKFSNIKIIGMGGSILGAEAIYDFLKSKIKKNIIFINNLSIIKQNLIPKKKKFEFNNLKIWKYSRNNC